MRIDFWFKEESRTKFLDAELYNWPLHSLIPPILVHLNCIAYRFDYICNFQMRDYLSKLISFLAVTSSLTESVTSEALCCIRGSFVYHEYWYQHKVYLGALKKFSYCPFFAQGMQFFWISSIYDAVDWLRSKSLFIWNFLQSRTKSEALFLFYCFRGWCYLVSWSVCRSVGLSVKIHFPCSYRSTC